MKFTVYHIDMWRYLCLLDKWHRPDENSHAVPCPAPDFSEYVKVAEVTLGNVTVEANLEDVFRLTNHIDHDWTKNPEVKAFGNEHRAFGNEHRSTSVGDIVVTETGDRYICQSFGWKKLENAEPVQNPS